MNLQKPTVICLVFSVFSLLAIALGIVLKMPIIIVVMLLATVVYELMRVEGIQTKAASLAILVFVILEGILIQFSTQDIVASLTDTASGASDLTDLPVRQILEIGIPVLIPVIIALLAIYLITHTAGKYTIWLAIVICITSLALVYAVNPALPQMLLGTA